MSNPTILVAPFTDSLAYSGVAGDGVFTGVDPIRYDGGLWVEEATINYHGNPSAEYDDGGAFSVASNGAVQTYVTSQHYSGAQAWQVDYDGSPFGLIQFGGFVHFPSLVGTTVNITASIYEKALSGAGPIDFDMNFFYDSTFVATGLNPATPGTDWSRRVVTLSQAVTTSYEGLGVRLLNTGSGAGVDFTEFVDALQVELKDHATSYADYTMGAGYGGSATNPSTRAASSASLAMDEPASLACWYREEYSGDKQFAYLDTLGQLGDYGDISYAAGDLTISTARNLVIGPFATFDRELTTAEQVRLAATQSWDMETVLGGSKIIMPLGARRRRR